MKKRLMWAFGLLLAGILAFSAMPLFGLADGGDPVPDLQCCNYHNECTSGTCGEIQGCSAGAKKKCVMN